MSTVWTGRQLGNYRLMRLIGHGGYADVYLGEHVYLKTNAAIKVLHTQLTPADVENFRTEALTIAHLVHPHIIRVFDFNVLNNVPFLVMDYAPNGTLRQRHPKGSRLTPDVFLPYVRAMASALQYAHDQKLIHRDIKPENMLLGANNEVLLSDFGIAVVSQNSHSQTTDDIVLGTMAYMAPEQLQGKPRPASDQYALAIVVYEWLSGTRPFNGTYVELLSQHLSTDPPLLDEQTLAIPHAVQQVIRKALAKDPHQRFERVQDFADALEGAYHSSPIATPAAPGVNGSAQSLTNTTTQTTDTNNVAPRLQQSLYQAAKPMQPFALASVPQITTSARRIGHGLGRLTRVLLITLLVTAILVCGLGYAAYNHFFASQNVPAPTVNQSGAMALANNFMQAISTRNYDQAYNDLGQGLAARKQFTQDAQSEDQCNGPITTYKLASTTLRGHTLADIYQVTRSKLAQTYPLTLTLQGDSAGRWRITDYNSQAPACSS